MDLSFSQAEQGERMERRSTRFGRPHVARRADEPHELVDGRRLVLHPVGVVRRVADQRVRDLRLAEQDGLRPGGLRDGGDADGSDGDATDTTDGDAS